MKRTQQITRFGLTALLAVLMAAASPVDDVFAQRREGRSKSRVEQRDGSKKKAARVNKRVAQRQVRTNARKQAARPKSVGNLRENGENKARKQRVRDRDNRRDNRREIAAVNRNRDSKQRGVKKPARRKDNVRRAPADRPPRVEQSRKQRVRRQAVNKPNPRGQKPGVKQRDGRVRQDRPGQRQQDVKARPNRRVKERPNRHVQQRPKRRVKNRPNRYVKPKYRHGAKHRAHRHAHRKPVRRYYPSHRRYVYRHPHRWRTWVPHDYWWHRKRHYNRHYRPYRWYYKRHYYRHHHPAVGFYIHVPVYRYYESRASRAFVFRQIVETKSKYADGYRTSELDVRTTLRKRVRDVSRNRVRIDFEIERMSIYANGTFLGDVTRIPKHLRRVRATVHNDGYVEFDRMVYLIGDPGRGFELLSTKYFGGNLVENYEEGHDLRVGWLDFSDRRVRDAEYSELFDPYDMRGLVPVELIPDDEQWGFQYLAGGYSRSGAYYSGSYDYYASSTLSDDGYYRRSNSVDGWIADSNGFSTVPGNESFSVASTFANEAEFEYRGESDESVSVNRKVFIESVPN